MTQHLPSVKQKSKFQIVSKLWKAFITSTMDHPLAYTRQLNNNNKNKPYISPSRTWKWPTCEQKVVLWGDWSHMKNKSPCGAQTDSRPLCGGNTLTGSDRDQWSHHRNNLYCKQKSHRTQEETIYWPTLTAYWKLPTFIMGAFVHSNTNLKERAIWQTLVVNNQTFSKDNIKTSLLSIKRHTLE